MVLALNISIEKEGSIVDVYDKIFSLDGGIYDRCINNKSFAEPHRIGEVKKQIHQISRDIAIWMFENNPEETSIPQEECKKICSNIVKEHQKSGKAQQDFLIGNFFKLKHCEGMETEELYFVHRSIYEYFVAETIFTSMYEALDVSKERLAYVFGKMLKGGTLSTNIIDYLRHKIISSKLNNAFNIVNESFQLMLQDGMTYYTGECYKNVVEYEMNVFANMLEIIHLFENSKLIELGNSIGRYIRYNRRFGLNLNMIILSKMNLSGADLIGADLREADLIGADLRGADLRDAYISMADLREANLLGVDLIGANLNEANLNEANLEGANLIGAILDERQIANLEKRYNLYGSGVYIKELPV